MFVRLPCFVGHHNWSASELLGTATVYLLDFERGIWGGWHEPMVLVCLPLAAPIGLSPLHILTLCGSERVLAVSTEPLDDLSCLTTPR